MRTRSSHRLFPVPIAWFHPRLLIPAMVGFALALLLIARAEQPAEACHVLGHELTGCLATALPTLPILPTLLPDTPTPVPDTPTPIPDTPTPVPPPPTDTPVPVPSATDVPPTNTPAVPTTPPESPATVAPNGSPPPGQSNPPDVSIIPTTNPLSATETATAETDDPCAVRLPDGGNTTGAPLPSTGSTIAPNRVACAGPGTTVTYTHAVRNTSPQAQVLNVSTFSAFGWEVELYHDDGQTRLTDTNGDGRLDVGRLQANSEVAIVVAVTIPSTARSGVHNVVSVFVAETRRDHGPCSWVNNRTMALGAADES